MQQHGHIEIPRACSVSVFSSGGAVPSSGWLTWEKPAGASMVYMWAFGGGGGGGGGQSSPAGTARGGGGGGQSAGTHVMIYPATALPDFLYIMVGKGGKGGMADCDGEEGQVTTISIDPQIDLYTWLVISGTCNPSGGKAGYRGTGGAGGQERDIQFDLQFGWWTYSLSVGRRDDYGYPNFANRGAAGGSSQVGGTRGFGGGEIVGCGGAGGGGVSSSNVAYAGGAITGRGVIPGLSAGAAGGGNGNDGWNNLCAEVPSNTTLMYASGASGGGGSTTTGGKGGKGGFGCGGGGGGAGVTGGAGGDGGDGVALLIAW